MYIDGVVVFGLVVLFCCCAMVGYLGYYAWKKINNDIPAEEQNEQA